MCIRDRRLDVSGNDIGGDGAWWLADAIGSDRCELRSLNLGSNRIGDGGAKDIAEELRVNSTLHVLDLRRNGISAEGAMELAHALEENVSITSMTLRGNVIPVGSESTTATQGDLRDALARAGLRVDVGMQQQRA